MEQGIYSIGHGARSLADFIALLQRYRIFYLADVRTFPFSRFHNQYNGAALDAALQEAGIRYVYLGDALGGRPADEDCRDEAGEVDYNRLKKKASFRAGIQRLVRAAADKVPLAIMCSERDPACCHRSRLIGAALEEEGINVWHIDAAGKLRNQAQVMASVRRPDEGKLFDL